MVKKIAKNTLLQALCDLKCDRFNYLKKLTQAKNIPFKVLEIDNSKHIVLYPENLKTGSTTLLAHYDRVENTPGANDNSASVFFLFNHGIKLLNYNHNTVIIFTDKEEIQKKDSVTDQGSYGLGRYFNENSLKLNIYIFDMCGIGTTLLLGTAGENLIKEKYGESYQTSIIKQEIEKTKEHGESVLLSSNYGEFFYLTPLFSDDLGLILNNYPSILISLLPYREAIEYKKDKTKLPKSWQNNHTMDDTLDTLDDKSHGVLSPLLDKLSGIYKEKNSNGLLDSFNCYTQTVNERVFDKAKPIRTYIIQSPVEINNINTKNQNRLEIFRLLISKTTHDVINLFKLLIENISHDMHYSIYNYIKNFVNSDFRLLPTGFKSQITRVVGNNNEDDVTNYLFNNTIKNIESDLEPRVKPVNRKLTITNKIISTKNGFFTYVLLNDNTEIGKITLKVGNFEVLMLKGNFNPEEILKLDALNLLKGIRTTLIKWAKLNNNKSLKIDLTQGNWLGCYNLYNLLKLELDGRSDIIWREYNGSKG